MKCFLLIDPFTKDGDHLGIMSVYKTRAAAERSQKLLLKYIVVEGDIQYTEPQKAK